MAVVGFIGLGNMGGPMAANLVKAGHSVQGFDLVPEALETARENGITVKPSAGDAAAGADVVITMLPAGQHVLSVLTGGEGLIASAASGALFIDCSTIDVTSARKAHEEAVNAGALMLDAPVSGGIAGASAGTPSSSLVFPLACHSLGWFLPSWTKYAYLAPE